MNTLVVCYSKYGNTYRIAQAIADPLEARGDVKTIDFTQLTVDDLEASDLLVVGTPTHNMNLPKKLKPVIEHLPRGCLAGKPVAVFDTSYKMSWLLNRFTASKRLAKKMSKLGGKLVVPPEIFLVAGREGPLIDGEVSRAKNWGDLLISKAGN